jgi:hypothetical protein
MTDYASYRQGVKEDETEDETPMIRRSIKKFLLNKKKETKDETGHSKYYPGGKTPGLTTDVLNTILTNMGKGMKSDKNEVTEKWSEKYKKSINCSNPKGFSQKAHCDGKKKETKEATGSGSSGAYSGPVFGGNDEFWERSRRETPKLKESDVEKVEAKEATTTGSSGAYESPSMWAKSTKIKKKCTKFPYCNQGDINNVKISKNESVKEAIKNVSSKIGISENVIKTILEHEYEKMNKRHN